MLTEIRARITYTTDGEYWTRGEETFLGHTEYGDYLYRNADRIQEVFLVSIGNTTYNTITARNGGN
jgi:hypothetical protein